MSSWLTHSAAPGPAASQWNIHDISVQLESLQSSLAEETADPPGQVHLLLLAAYLLMRYFIDIPF